MFMNLDDLSDKNPAEAIRAIENYLRENQERLEYILTHLDSSNVIELDIKKTKVYKGEENELQ